MTKKPVYFDDIQKKAANRWDQLEKDPELAAPWRQLFKQVQSPRHVLSELLQNADDAEATKVFVEIKDGYFVFTHNGKDFSKEDFASLCRFGYSNKRMLHTIGFRGIGFKSTFSLGDTVELRTPSLSVMFKKERFTQPVWIDEKISNSGTTIRVKIQDTNRQKELETNIEEWLSSPFSLLFFKHIRQLKLGARELHWKKKGDGPAAGSEFMQLQGEVNPYLVIRSKSEPFPEEALQEIFEERLLETGEKMELPPCKVEIVLGAPGKLFVVLPTGVRTNLPFAINAPFIQDPARLKIKDPEISFTNRWLLRRVGEMVAEAMLNWLNHGSLSADKRAGAYDMLPVFDEENSSLESICESTVEEYFRKNITDKPFVLTENGELEYHSRSVWIPDVIWKIWSEEQILSIISGKFKNRSILSSVVSRGNQDKLLSFRAVLPVKIEDIQNILLEQKLPLPAKWASLLELWNMAGQWKYFWRNKNLHIYPVRGQKILYSANEVVRLGEKKLLQSEKDWEFLSKYLLVVDVNWLRYLTEQRRLAEDKDRDYFEKLNTAEQLLSSTGMDKPSNTDMVIAKVARDFFEKKTSSLSDSVRITQIAAKLNAKIGPEFKFWACDNKLYTSDKIIIFDTSTTEEFIPSKMIQSTLLNLAYSRKYESCTKDEWSEWIQSDNTWVNTFVPVKYVRKQLFGKKRLQQELELRGYKGDISLHYVTSDFVIEDFDFPEEYWNFWEQNAVLDPSFWGKLVEQLIRNPKSWKNFFGANIFQISTSNSQKKLTDKPLPAAWTMKLWEKPCLRDTNGRYRNPPELMCRTPETEPHMGIEPFVHAKLDTHEVRSLLVNLGVRTLPSGPKQILERLHALSKSSKPPIPNLVDLYERLDKLFENCSTEDQIEIRRTFKDNALIFTEDGSWQTSGAVFIFSDENDAPGAALIHSRANHLSLWRKIDVRERPTVDLAIGWLMQLPVEEKLSTSDVRRIRALLGRHPIRIWNECRHWLNLSSEWVPVEDLKYALSMQSLFSWGRLHEWVKKETADFQMLSVELLRESPFYSLPALGSKIERRLEKSAKQGRRINLTWLNLLGKLLMRIKLEDKDLNDRLHAQATRLANTIGMQVEKLNTLPYLNGKPAGLPEDESIAWIETTLYLTPLSDAKLVRIISERVAEAFGWNDMKAILAYCFERRESEIRSYMEENYTLVTEELIAPVHEEVADSVEKDQQPISGGKLPVKQNPVLVQGGSAAKPESMADEGNDNDVSSKSPKENPARPSAPMPPLIERFALAQEFEKNGKQMFTHADGRVLIKSDGVFHWEMITSTRIKSLHFWVKEHCLEAKPLEIPTEIWNRVEQAPQEHALLLEDRNRKPVIYSGKDLLLMNKEGKLNLYSATYRIVLESGD